MDNSNSPTDVPVQNSLEQVTPPVAAPTPQLPSKKPRNWANIALIVAAVLVCAALIVAAYFMGKKSGEDESVRSNTADTTAVSSETLVEEIEESTAEVADQYEGWKTYESSVYDYTVKYPSDWQVERQSAQEPADWVSIKNPEGAAIVSIFTYFDGTGCPATITKEFTIGGYAVESRACVGTEQYKVTMKHSKTVSVNDHSIILAVAPPNQVGIQIDLSSGEDETMQLILDSIAGLTPYDY